MPIERVSKPLVSALLCGLGMLFYCFFLMCRPFEWSEEVQTLLPRTMIVSRSIERELAWNKRHGLGAIKSHSLTFASNGEKVLWHTGQSWKLNHMPEILAFVDGDPVLIFAVAQFVPCSSVGFPEDGLVAFQYQNRDWKRINTKRLSGDLKVNLLRETFEFQRKEQSHLSNFFSQEYRTVNLARKETLEYPLTRPQLGASLEMLSTQYVKYLDSCANVKAFSKGSAEIQ